MAVANRDASVRMEKVSAKVVTMRTVRAKGVVASGFPSSEGRKGVDSLTAASSWSSAGGSAGDDGDGSWSGGDAGMLVEKGSSSGKVLEDESTSEDIFLRLRLKI